MPITRLSAPETKAKLDEGYVYVDVRTEEEFEEGHPAGAINVPLALTTPHGKVMNPDFVAAMNALFDKSSAKVVLGCAAGVRSMTAGHLLLDEGWGELFELRPGWYGARDPFGRLREKGWEASGLPVEAGAPAERSWPDLKRKAGR